MTNFLQNKSAIIWAFDEMIDQNTNNDGNTHEIGYSEIKDIIEDTIKYVDILGNEDDDISTILTDYNNLISMNEIIIFNDTYIDIDSMCNKYYLCGWPNHSIIIFINNRNSTSKPYITYNLGIINCGIGIEFQGYNNEKCNGIIIFKDIRECNISGFLGKYRRYYKNTKNENIFQDKYVYKSFYLMLFHELFDEDEVNFYKLENEKKIICYKLPSQNIGSCVFTNTINIAYYLYVIKNPELPSDKILELYLIWYNKIKVIIKKKIYNEIISEDNTKNYNIYKYILDTIPEHVQRNSQYEVKYIINEITYDTNVFKPNTLCRLERRNPRSIYWEVYVNNSDKWNEKFIDLYNKASNDEKDQYINELFDFFIKTNSFINDEIPVFIPLLILYNLKKKYKDTFIIKQSVIDTLMNSHYTTYDYNTSLYTNILPLHIICTCIYILLFIDNIDRKYYNNTDTNYIEKQNKNFEYYNYRVFQYIPIINTYYYNIITILIYDIYKNMEILPDIENEAFFKNNEFIFNNTTRNNCLLKNHFSHSKITNFSIINKIKIIDGKYNTINFLSWYIFIYNTNNKAEDIDKSKKFKFKFEEYGYIEHEFCLSSMYQEKKIIVTTAPSKTHPGSNILYLKKISIFFSDIERKLLTHDITNLHSLSEILKLYIIYFYLCYLKETIINEDHILFRKYNDKLITYFKYIYYGPFITITDVYIKLYNRTFLEDKYIFIIDDNTLIPSMEKKFFTLKKYEYIPDDNLYQSLFINFYILYTTKYKLVFIQDKNTKESFDIITKLSETNIFSNYILLNFSFKKINIVQDNDQEIFTGIHKINTNHTIRYVKNSTSNTVDYLVNNVPHIVIHNDKIDIELQSRPKEFYNLMLLNDDILFLYKRSNIYYLRAYRYNFIFIIKNQDIYIEIDNIEYIVKWCNDEDNYNNYGILKLYKEPDLENDVKIICIYNYNYITKNTKNNLAISFIDKEFKSSENDVFTSLDLVADEYKIYYHTILNKYKNKYILTNISDVLALLINCLYYNSPFLILNNIEQIKIILNNNNHDKINLNKLLNTLFLNFDNIYRLPILFLFYEKNNNSFYYESSNNIYKCYKILLKLQQFNPSEYNYLKLTVIQEPIYELLFFQNLTVKYSFILAGNELYLWFINTRYNMTILSTSLNSDISVKSECIVSIPYKQNTTGITLDLFKELMEKFILCINDESFNNNITKATELYKYLINDTPNNNEIYPIQELLMGSGKSTVLTSYICILLLNNFLLQENFIKKEIYIVIPDSLINSSFETLMKYVFPLFNNIEILIYPNKSLYNNLNHFYLNLITDTNYKIMFLTTELTNYNNSYMIYDEVDMIANPLICELNIPMESRTLSSIDELFKLSNILYNDIFMNDEFWTDIVNKKTNDIHKYIYEFDETDYAKIISHFNKKFAYTKLDTELDTEPATRRNIINYIKDNILIFILTKQFNFDYGIPENYNIDTVYKYKFKAIPYSAVDSPIIGSEFSDPILTYILTLFCYKLVRGNFRKIDKDYMIEYYGKLYEENSTENTFNILHDFFDVPTFNYIEYKNNKEYYIDKYKKVVNIFNTSNGNLDIIIKKILEMNQIYYKKCKNISFNDLLLEKYVKRFICFTGTAYIKPPKGLENNMNFHETNFITRSKINDRTVEENVKYIINNPTIITNIYNNTDSNLVENIFNCLHSYDVLIDIGGIFISYNITKFIEKYTVLNPTKKYIVYFDNGRKIYNLHTNEPETDKSILQIKNEVFFYFSNKDITGVDTKDIMDPNVRALVVITNTTNMRDFSQGIFRMRRLLDPKHETFDIVFDQLFISIIQKGGCTKFIENKHNNIRNFIYENLIHQQNIITEQKEKVLGKQNILGLCKNRLDSDNIIDLFIDPNDTEYQTAKDNFKRFKTEFKTILSKHVFTDKTIDIEKINYDTIKFNIDNINISNIDNILNEIRTNNILMYLFITYFNLLESSQNMSVMKINTTTQIEINSETESQLEVNKSIITKDKPVYNGIIYSDLTYHNSIDICTSNQLLCLYKFENTIVKFINHYDVLLIYDKDNNNLVILSTNQLMKFLMYNTNISKYTFISLYNNSYYGISITEDDRKYLITQALKIFKNDITVTSLSLDKLILNLSTNAVNNEYKTDATELQLQFVNSYIHTKSFYIKYIKYKNKYLDLIKENS